jgi:hypothetical protein
MDLQEKKKIESQSIQMFGMAEKPIMRYIASFLDETHDAIFLENLPDVEDPLILLPMDDYKKNIYIKFTLATVGPEYKLDLKNLIDHDLIKEAIGFLYYCVRTVYGSIVSSSLINNKPMITTVLELDEKNWVFTPKFMHEETKKRVFLQEALGKLMYMMKDPEIDKSMLPKINEEYKKVLVALAELGEPSDAIKSLEEQINNTYDSKPRLGIFVEEIHKNKLPKPKPDPRITNKEKELPSISGGLYANTSKEQTKCNSSKHVSRPATQIDLIKEVSEEFDELHI